MSEVKIKISENLQNLANILKNKAELYVVGGYVRNALMNNYDTDIDICSKLTTQELITVLKNTDFKVAEKNKKLGTSIIKIKNEEYEHSTFRAEEYDGTGKHSPEKITFIQNVVEDAKRRDFTCNSIYYDINNKRIIDVYSGVYDINIKSLKCIETPNEVLQNDGLRILRMIRQSNEINFKIEKHTYSTAKRMVYRLKDISGSRKLAELKLILNTDNKYSISKPKSYIKALEMFNDLKIFPLFYIPVDKVKLVMIKKIKTEDRFIALLIDIVNAVNPDCVEYFLQDLLGNKGLCLSNKISEEYIKIVCGYFDALNRRGNKEYFFKYYDHFNVIRDYLKYTNKKLYEKYNFFYRYILYHNIPVRIKDLTIDGNDIKKTAPKIDDKNISKLLKDLLEKVFDNEINNSKTELLEEVKNTWKSY